MRFNIVTEKSLRSDETSQINENKAWARALKDKNWKINVFPTNAEVRSEWHEDVTREFWENQPHRLQKKKLAPVVIQKIVDDFKALTIERIALCAKIQSLKCKNTKKGATSRVIRKIGNLQPLSPSITSIEPKIEISRTKRR